MPAFGAVRYLAPAGSTGNLTSAGFALDPDADSADVEFIVEAAGATPTVTWKAQLSVDGVNWFDAFYVTEASDAAVATAIVQTAVGSKVAFIELGQRDWQLVRVVVSANTNITFRCELRSKDSD